MFQPQQLPVSNSNYCTYWMCMAVHKGCAYNILLLEFAHSQKFAGHTNCRLPSQNTQQQDFEYLP